MTIQASIGTVSVPLFVGQVTGREAEVVSVFRLGDGDWNVVARVMDQSGRVTEAGLSEIGGSGAVTLPGSRRRHHSNGQPGSHPAGRAL